ncbi:type II toxin-antitoxin system RelE/ParE family toxin [Pelobacter propionicus]|uniref:Addiction module toxin, RelE/StbE family n=1 Tax=Pelobacter propionicus (strain DSM 2379 / NBRC 103807 / OttBd1) TaxID=338966 RepID=A0R864_PELPD|nr:type II toxin-antitoxin system RelE/ParE family toxin [Pelobacter propionicus]ABL01431.1 addiction module toxin, RelE/StbE family [Pelobacter propionicus DSM 2379]
MIRWLRRAERDLVHVEAYIAQDNPRAAVAMVLTIIEAVEQLDAHPGMGRAGRVEGTRELVVAGTPYVVPYRQKGKWIEILRVYHAARLWPEAF